MATATVSAVLTTACHSVNHATARKPGSVRTSPRAPRVKPRPMIDATGQAKKTARNRTGTAASAHGTQAGKAATGPGRAGGVPIAGAGLVRVADWGDFCTTGRHWRRKCRGAVTGA